MIKNIRIKIELFLLRKYLNAIVESDILSIDSNKNLRVDGIKLEPSQVHNLVEEAKLITRTELWGLLVNTLKKAANDLQVKKAVTMDDVRNGRMMLYCIDIINNTLTTIKSKEIKK